MDATLFKTAKLAEAYISRTYPASAGYRRNYTTIDDRCRVTAVDMPNLCWSGDMSATEILNKEGNTVEIVASWESGDDVYELYDDEQLICTFDNSYDAREAQKSHRNSRLLCDGEEL